MDFHAAKRPRDSDPGGPPTKRLHSDPQAILYLTQLPFPFSAPPPSTTPELLHWWERFVQYHEQQSARATQAPTVGKSLQLKQASILRWLGAPGPGPSSASPMDVGGPECLCGAVGASTCAYCGRPACRSCAAQCGRCGDGFCGVCSQVYYGHRATQSYCLNCIQLVQ